MNNSPKNWAGNIAFSTSNLHTPESVNQVREIVAAAEKIKVLGTRHSFNRIADSEHTLISLEKMDRVIETDTAHRTVAVEAGITYGQLAPILQGQGFALHNLASLPHISVAGAVATATHGSGSANQNLSAAVAAFEFIDARGELNTVSRREDPERFPGMVVHLGALGVVTKLTLNMLPTFDVRQTTYEDLPHAALASDPAAVFDAGYSVSLFTDWQGETFHQVWVKQKMDEPDLGEKLQGARRAARKWHPVPSQDPAACTEQLGKPGPWHARLPHFKMDFTPSSGEELQTEYFVAREHAYDALQAIKSLAGRISPLLFVTEVRAVAADDLWLSPHFGRQSIGIHFTWKPDTSGVTALLPELEARLAPFGVRPHWGKLFDMGAEALEERYPRWGDFRKLAAALDPGGKFRNDFLDGLI